MNRLNRRGASNLAELQPLESRRLFAVGTTASISAVPTQEFGLDFTVKGVVKQTKGAFTPHGEVDLLNNNILTAFTTRVDHLGRYSFKFTAGDALPVATGLFSVRYLGAAGKFAASRSKVATVTITPPSAFSARLDILQSQTLVAGTGTRKARSGDTLTLEETGYNNKTVVVVTAVTGATTFVLNASPEQVFPGVDQALVGMKVGETRAVYVPSSLANNDGLNYLFVFKLDAIT